MLLNLKHLPQQASLYDNLKASARSSKPARLKLAALQNTLRHYNVNDDTLAEAILRLDAMCGNRKPHPGDERAKMLFQMHTYFVGQYNT